MGARPGGRHGRRASHGTGSARRPRRCHGERLRIRARAPQPRRVWPRRHARAIVSPGDLDRPPPTDPAASTYRHQSIVRGRRRSQRLVDVRQPYGGDDLGRRRAERDLAAFRHRLGAAVRPERHHHRAEQPEHPVLGPHRLRVRQRGHRALPDRRLRRPVSVQGLGHDPCDTRRGELRRLARHGLLRRFDGRWQLELADVDQHHPFLAAAPKDKISQNGCVAAGCTKPVDCPSALDVKAGGKVVGCISACARLGGDQYCCRGQWSSRSACDPAKWPVDYAAVFKGAEPYAYSYVDDDATSVFTCVGSLRLPDHLRHHAQEPLRPCPPGQERIWVWSAPKARQANAAGGTVRTPAGSSRSTPPSS